MLEKMQLLRWLAATVEQDIVQQSVAVARPSASGAHLSRGEPTPAFPADFDQRALLHLPSLSALDLEQITYKIIGCAMDVHRRKGPGYREDTYQRDMQVQIEQTGLFCTPQQALEVYDSAQGGKLIGYYVPDFIVARRVIVEIKALSALDNSHLAQVIGYLVTSGCAVGLLINFGERTLRWRRILPPRKVTEHVVNRQWLFVPDSLRQADAAEPSPTDEP